MRAVIVTSSAMFLTFPVTANAQISWSVFEPFRFFQEGSDFSIRQGQTASAFVVSQFARRDRSDLPPVSLTLWNQDNKSMVRLDRDYVFPNSVKSSATLEEPTVGQCIWTYDDRKRQRQSCSKPYYFSARTQFGEGEGLLKVELEESNTSFETKAHVYDRLVLGLGDSYASGEGNPDIPAKVDRERVSKLAESIKNSKFPRGAWLENHESWRDDSGTAVWLDKQCHRSIVSQHVLAALRLATRDPHESVTLIPLACSGAEIVDGLLKPQSDPPGTKYGVLQSQVNQAVRLLCSSERTSTSPKKIRVGRGSTAGFRTERVMIASCETEMRVPDALLLSIGGNDIGFGGVIRWATLPGEGRSLIGNRAVALSHNKAKPVCAQVYKGIEDDPDENLGFKCKKRFLPTAEDRITHWLPVHFDALSTVLNQTGIIRDPVRVFLTAYPNPLYREDGNRCDFGDGYNRTHDGNERALRYLPPILRPSRWEMGFSSNELDRIEAGVIRPLAKTLQSIAARNGWHYLDGYVGTINRHGICAGYARVNGVFPYPHVRNEKWVPLSPAEMWAYDEMRARWFRNTVDAVLFQSDGTDAAINGAYHPDFRVHALIADYLFDEIDRAWSSE